MALLEKFFPGEYAEAMNAEHVAGAETDVDDMDVSGDGSGSEASDTESLPEVGDLLLQGDSESDSDVDPGVVQLQVHVEDE